MDRFVRSFEKSARRWELIIYPAMLAFVILAAYGFFLIYTLSKDVHFLASSMDPELGKHPPAEALADGDRPRVRLLLVLGLHAELQAALRRAAQRVRPRRLAH